jgi:hypothetical protein
LHWQHGQPSDQIGNQGYIFRPIARACLRYFFLKKKFSQQQQQQQQKRESIFMYYNDSSQTNFNKLSYEFSMNNKFKTTLPPYRNTRAIGFFPQL